MHDPRVLLDPATDAVRKLTRRGFALDVASLEKLLAARNSAIQRGDEARSESKRVAAAVKAVGRDGGPQERDALVARARELKGVVAAAEEEHRDLEAELQDFLLGVPNLPSDDLPDGASDEDAEQVRVWGEPTQLDFTALDHVDIGEKLGILDLPRATKLAGPRFAVLRGKGAALERAIARYLLDLHTQQHGYTEWSVPTLVNRVTMTGTGQLPKFEQDLFKTGVADRELYLIPTAEVPLTNLHAKETLAAEDLPLAYTAHTPCFRSEAGSAGRDTRGMIRQHQFAKVELVSIAIPEDSEAEHERMTACAEEVLKRLGLAYRVMLLSSGDMGFAARKTYDLEVWLPGQNAYREISSCSNCGPFQATRMKARVRSPGGKGTRPVHTLNGSALAVGRTMIAVLENFQRADGSVTIPEALRPYMAGQTAIEPNGSQTHG
jgi:seryl-tRNA synthetase